jgi:transcriptional regulator with XRE-family HTH domain
MNIKTKIGIRVKELRANKKISQEKLAELADLDRTYINSVENGRRNISIENVEKIANALDVSLQEFFNEKKFKTNGK